MVAYCGTVGPSLYKWYKLVPWYQLVLVLVSGSLSALHNFTGRLYLVVCKAIHGSSTRRNGLVDPFVGAMSQPMTYHRFILLGLIILASSAARQRRQPQRVAAPTTSGDRLDTEAAARGVEGLDAAPRTELVQRVAALKKQTELLQKADKFARAEFSRRPGAVATPPAVVPEAANASVVVALEELSLEQLRSLVRVLVDENKLWQRVEHASRTALQALDTPASNTSAAMVFAAPPAAWRCARLEPSAAALRGAFEEPRHDGRAQPPSMSVKWRAWLCYTPNKESLVWLAKSAAHCDAGHLTRTLSYDTVTAAKIAAGGPDELLGTLHGPEATALRWTHEGKCAYAGTFRVAAGVYHLQVAHLREGYGGLAEDQPIWPHSPGVWLGN